jgi:hypothetical protein
MESPPKKIWPFARYYQKLDPNEGDAKLMIEMKAIWESRHHNVHV